MCGIVGASAKSGTTFSRQDMNMLFLMNEHRGKDSWGFYNNNPKIPFADRVQKKLGLVSEKMVPNNKYTETNLFFGHVRAKTRGDVNVDNAHPFVFDHIIGCHNGTVTNYDLLRREWDLGDDKEINMDSKVFFKYLSKFEDYTIMKELNGAANLVWVDEREPDVLFVFKHKERTLFRGVKGKGDNRVMYISSTREGLLAIECSNIVTFKDSHVYKIKDGLVQGKPQRIKPDPRMQLSEKRRKELYPPKPPAKVNVKEDFKNDSKSHGDAIDAKVTVLPTPDVKGGGELLMEDSTVWLTKKYEDGTTYRFRKDYDKPVTIHSMETTLDKERGMWIRTLYFTDGGYLEVRLGLPTFHYDPKTGEVLRPLSRIPKPAQSNTESKSKDVEIPFDMNEYTEFMLTVGTMIEDPVNGIREKLKAKNYDGLSEDLEKLDDVRDEISSEIGQILDEKIEVEDK